MIVSNIKRIAKKILPERIHARIRQHVIAVLENRKIKVERADSASIKMSYGGHAPRGEEFVSGGRVKLRPLAEEFPEQSRRINILYLVSSHLPKNAHLWVKKCRGAGVKIVWNQNGVGYPAWAGADYQAINQSMKDLISQADFVVYQSEFCKASADEFLGPVKVPFRILYNAVDMEEFSPAKVVPQMEPLKLLVMGTHHESPRVMIALEALAILMNKKVPVQLTIGGRLSWSETAQEDLNARIEKLGVTDSVFIPGPYSQTEAPEYYRRAHVLLHLKYKDPCPTVAIESMACGLPIVSSGSGGMGELLGEDAGVLLSVQDSWDRMYYPEAAHVAEAVLKISADQKRWSKAARNRAVSLFSTKKWLEHHRRVFQEVLG